LTTRFTKYTIVKTGPGKLATMKPKRGWIMVTANVPNPSGHYAYRFFRNSNSAAAEAWAAKNGGGELTKSASSGDYKRQRFTAEGDI